MSEPILNLDDVAVTYSGAVPVEALRAASVSVTAGEIIGVVGRSGSGKSTLLNVLGLLDRPTAGRYLIRGVNTADLPEAALTALRGQEFGFVFQSFHLLADRSVRENAELGLIYQHVPRAERRVRAITALEQVGLGHRLNARPGTLSGGERQRVAIARALATRPEVLLCDEPTGNLDRRTSAAVMELLSKLNKSGLIIIIVTHDHEIASALPRRLVIEDGIVTGSLATSADGDGQR